MRQPVGELMRLRRQQGRGNRKWAAPDGDGGGIIGGGKRARGGMLGQWSAEGR